MFSASTIKKWGGGSKEEAAIFLHGIEQDFGHKVQSIWEGNVLECAFAGDVNKLEIVKSCSKAAQAIIETYKDERKSLWTIQATHLPGVREPGRVATFPLRPDLPRGQSVPLGG